MPTIEAYCIAVSQSDFYHVTTDGVRTLCGKDCTNIKRWAVFTQDALTGIEMLRWYPRHPTVMTCRTCEKSLRRRVHDGW